MIAADRGNVAAVQALLNAGKIDLDAKDMHGHTALDRANASGRPGAAEIAQLIKEKQAEEQGVLPVFKLKLEQLEELEKRINEIAPQLAKVRQKISEESPQDVVRVHEAVIGIMDAVHNDIGGPLDGVLKEVLRVKQLPGASAKVHDLYQTLEDRTKVLIGKNSGLEACRARIEAALKIIQIQSGLEHMIDSLYDLSRELDKYNTWFARNIGLFGTGAKLKAAKYSQGKISQALSSASQALEDVKFAGSIDKALKILSNVDEKVKDININKELKEAGIQERFKL